MVMMKPIIAQSWHYSESSEEDDVSSEDGDKIKLKNELQFYYKYNNGTS